MCFRSLATLWLRILSLFLLKLISIGPLRHSVSILRNQHRQFSLDNDSSPALNPGQDEILTNAGLVRSTNDNNMIQALSAAYTKELTGLTAVHDSSCSPNYKSIKAEETKTNRCCVAHVQSVSDFLDREALKYARMALMYSKVCYNSRDDISSGDKRTQLNDLFNLAHTDDSIDIKKLRKSVFYHFLECNLIAALCRH